MTASPWLQRLSPRPDAPVRLFCFHHAGGSAASFRHWPAKLPQFDICAVQLPGRATRLGEPPMTRIPQIVDALLPDLLPLLDRPYALFGHSMGSAVAHALAARLHAIDAPAPAQIFVSGRQPPHKPFPECTLNGLTDAEAIDEINRHYGGIPEEVRAWPELLEMLLPTLRSDIEALEHYSPTIGTPLPVVITAFGGESDTAATPDHLASWQAYTPFPMQIRMFPGGHFYLDDCLDSVAAECRVRLAKELARPFAALPRENAA
jgi:medium-chain acyl-[acyl-carrier-protein] hydrolase